MCKATSCNTSYHFIRNLIPMGQTPYKCTWKCTTIPDANRKFPNAKCTKNSRSRSRFRFGFKLHGTSSDASSSQASLPSSSFMGFDSIMIVHTCVHIYMYIYIYITVCTKRVIEYAWASNPKRQTVQSYNRPLARSIACLFRGIRRLYSRRASIVSADEKEEDRIREVSE